MGKKDWRTTYLKPSEVVLHYRPDDCWVSLLGVVKDITPLIQEYRNTSLIKPLLAEAGKDISHWFNEDGDIQTFVHPVTGAIMPYLPHGKIPHAEQSDFPDPDWMPSPQSPWWKDDKYNVGKLSKNIRPIRILNILTQKEIMLNDFLLGAQDLIKITSNINTFYKVCGEETIEQIRDRYLPFNSNAKSYTWKYYKKKLAMNKTLEENGIKDEKQRFRFLGLPEDLHTPCLMLYYDDDYE